jgi:hypothetical protein
VTPAFGPHLYPALIDPVEDANLVREAGVVGGVQAAESKVFDEGREIVLTLGSPTYCWSRHFVSHRIFLGKWLRRPGLVTGFLRSHSSNKSSCLANTAADNPSGF